MNFIFIKVFTNLLSQHNGVICFCCIFSKKNFEYVHKAPTLFVAVFTKSLCHVMEVLSGPLINTLENRLEINRVRCQQLEKHKEVLLKKLEEMKCNVHGDCMSSNRQ